VTVDLGVLAKDLSETDLFCEIARELGIAGLAVPNLHSEPVKKTDSGLDIFRRIELHGRTINSLRKQVSKFRRKSLIVSVPLRGIEVANWAADDKRIDLLTLEIANDNRLRDTTAHLASNSGVSLEIQIAPLLKTSGLNRSKVLKSYRESVRTALDGGMGIVLTSGANHPLGLRSPVAMIHLGILLGMTRTEAEWAVNELPLSIITQNLKKLQSGFVGDGVEIIETEVDR
jgi:RNase P/RNase MRP subunit p30